MEKNKVRTTENDGRTEGVDAAKSEVAAREEEVLAFWNEQDIFNKSVEKDAPNGGFVFYDGPPFATGLPHYGHILASTIKDTVPRFWTMNGYRVRRTWGWDCHGLPLENIIEKRLGLATKRDIEEMGVKKFNETAREAVLEYADDWKRIIPRMGRWADMESDYKTMDPSYTESVWWVFKELHEKGLVFEGFKSMHLCPRCGTTLSNFEVNQGYKDIKDIAVTVKLPLLDEDGKPSDTSLLVWTTTPWTLPGNMAAAVHQDALYAKVKIQNEEGKVEFLILAKDRLEQLGDVEYEVVEEFKGEELLGKSYIPPFNYWQKQEFEGKENAWKIYHADYVEVGEDSEGKQASDGASGTGAVHLAPAYGEEDMELAEANGVPIVHHVGQDGRFMDFVVDFAGQLVKPKDDDSGVSHLDADIEIVKKLKADEKLFKKENVTHSYPHCWRCDTPLLNYATTSWFVKVTDIKDQLVAENKKVHWVPEHVGHARFGKWLEGARDWAVSRQRYWGAPLPIWRNPETKEIKVFGSLKELQEYVPKSGNQYFAMRHGEAEHNVQDIFSSTVSAEYALTEEGKAECATSAEQLQDTRITKIYTSPFKRCMETAREVAKQLGLSETHIETDERLGEINFGVYNDQPSKEYRSWEDATSNWFTDVPKGGESKKEVKRRLGEFLYELESKYTDERILVVTHAIGLKSLRMVTCGADDDTAKKMAEKHTKPGQLVELDFAPFPHNDNYELDFHRPYIDDFELVDTDSTKLERVPDVFDCWFESGSMPYGQHHYPFENTDVFDPREGKGYPANFIAEGLDQTRGWFYSLIVLGTALFGKSPYENVIVNGLVLAEDGKKMSKRLQNYPDPVELADRVGVDAMRFYLLSSPVIRGEDLNFSEKEVLELQRKNIGRLHNVLAMYEMYKTSQKSKVKSQKSEHVLDRWIVARLNELIVESTAGYKNYELDKATRPVTDFVDDLSVWYLRRSRDRLKSNDVDDKKAALSTLQYVLKNLALVMAPSMPFYADYLYRRVKEENDPESVHLADWPTAGEIDKALINRMDIVRLIVSSGLEARAKAQVKTRQPLQKLIYQTGSFKKSNEDFKNLLNLIRDEVNVKEIEEGTGFDGYIWLDTTITPELQKEGNVREFMRQVQDMRKKEGLSPHDRITLTIGASDAGKELIRMFEDTIEATVGADEIVFGDDTGEKVTVGEHSYTVALKIKS